MPTPRSKQISLSQTLYYHCVSRCVRRAYLCGKDALTGKSFEHRRGWVEKRLLFLAQVFCIDVCAYAVMSNHTHLVLRVNLDEANTLSDEQVLIRWHRIFKGTLLSQQYMRIEDRQQLTPAEIRQVKS
ncbi:transposase, partial [Aestuariibacter sp. AA17]